MHKTLKRIQKKKAKRKKKTGPVYCMQLSVRVYMQFGDDTCWSLMEVISSLKLSLRLAKDREQTLQDELLMARVVRPRRVTDTGMSDRQQRRRVKAKFHYTIPIGPDRTRADCFARPGSAARVSDKVRGLCLVGSGRARVVEFSYKYAPSLTSGHGTGSHLLLLPSDPAIQLPGDPVDPVDPVL